MSYDLGILFPVFRLIVTNVQGLRNYKDGKSKVQVAAIIQIDSTK